MSKTKLSLMKEIGKPLQFPPDRFLSA